MPKETSKLVTVTYKLYGPLQIFTYYCIEVKINEEWSMKKFLNDIHKTHVSIV
jgi:hypothetical protein